MVVEQQQNKYDYDNNIDTKICDPRIFKFPLMILANENAPQIIDINIKAPKNNEGFQQRLNPISPTQKMFELDQQVYAWDQIKLHKKRKKIN